MNFSWWKDEDIKETSVLIMKDFKDLNDLRLGATTTENCQTCFLPWKQCPGHFSCYEFMFPIIHPMMLSVAKKDLKTYKIKCKVFQNCLQLINPDAVNTKSTLTIFDLPKELINQKPTWLKKIIPISPTCIRPSCMTERGLSMNDLTHRIASLIRIDVNIRKVVEKNRFRIGDHKKLLQRLQLAYTLFFFPPSGARESRELSNISDRFKGKEGRFRQSNLGKRLEFSARSVITGDPFIDVDEIGIPHEVADKLTRPVLVNRYNIDKLSEDIYHNRIKYISNQTSNTNTFNKKKEWLVENLNNISLEDKTYRMIDPKFNRKPLKIGDIVHKKLQDGDYILVNRQPSLWKSSIQSMRVKKLPCKTFRLNVEVTPCFNADFDGDEMNCYLPQDISCAGEMKYIMHTSEHILSGGAGVVQDSALAAYFLSLPNTIVRKGVYFDCIYRIENAHMSDDTLKEPLTGRKLLSCFFEDTFNVDGVVQNGIIITTLNKKIIKKKLLSKIYKISPRKALHFLRDLQRVGAEYLRTRGFSIGISALEPDKELKGTDTNFQYTRGDEWYLLQKGRKEREKQALQIQELFSKDNDFISLTSEGSGAKGSLVNIVQMRCALGQQYYKGGLLPKFRGDRFLSSDTFNEDTIVNKGFITGNFLDGLTPKELFQHAVSSRLSLLDTALKTAETGYSSRRLSFCLQDIIVQYNDTITNGKRVLRFDKECLFIRGEKCEPGLALGIQASQMIGQMVMQLTLNSFHSAGEASEITSGVPRMEALINNWKKRQNVQRLLYRNNVTPLEGHKEIRKYDFQELGTYIEKYTKTNDSIELKLNKIQCIRKRIHQWDIHIALYNAFDQFIPEIIDYNIKLYRKQMNNKFPSKKDIYNLTIRGREKKEKVFWTNNVLSHKGFSLIEFMYKDIFFKTHSTSITETLAVFGIEAARTQLLIELKKVFNDGVDTLYLEVLVEWMTWLGQISAVTRSGLKLSNDSVYKNMAFERSLRVAATAASNESYATLDGTSERLICNKRILQGTGIVNLVSDKDILDDIDKHENKNKKRSRFIDTNEPWIQDTRPWNDNPFVGGGSGFNANPFGMMGGMMPIQPQSPTYDPFKPPSPVYHVPQSPTYDPFKPPSPVYHVPQSPTYDPFKPDTPPVSPQYDPNNPH